MKGRYIAGGLIALGIIIYVPYYVGTAGGNGATGNGSGGNGGSAAPPAVQVCSSAHYDKTDVVCRKADATLTQAQLDNQARIVYGGHFTSLTTVFQVSSDNRDGSEDIDGQYSNDETPLDSPQVSLELGGVLDQASISLVNGTTYHVSVINGGRQLGVATFTYKAR